MEIIDVVIFVLLVASVIVGVFRGFAKEFILLLGLVISLIAAYYGASVLSQRFGGGQWHLAGYPISMHMTGFIVTFMVLLTVLLILRRVVANVVGNVYNATGINLVDRLFGATFGVARGGLLITLMIAAGGLTMLSSNAWWQQSRLIPVFERFASYGIQELPPQYREYFYLPSVRSHQLEQ